jgi:N6-L-threonylcarbamoyladenine synthase
LSTVAEARGCRVYYPEPSLCTDNGAMIAFAGALRLADGQSSTEVVQGFTVQARWALETLLPA